MEWRKCHVADNGESHAQTLTSNLQSRADTKLIKYKDIKI